MRVYIACIALALAYSASAFLICQLQLICTFYILGMASQYQVIVLFFLVMPLENKQAKINKSTTKIIND